MSIPIPIPIALAAAAAAGGNGAPRADDQALDLERATLTLYAGGRGAGGHGALA